MERKTVYMMAASKGGAGKSVATWISAERYKDAVILDLDDATTTTMKQLAYRKPARVSFLDPQTKRIDRGAFNNFFESVTEVKKQLFIADLGASVAEQLPKYFGMTGAENISEILSAFNIDLKIVCIVGGGNIFRATMEYLDELVDSVEGKFDIIAAHNGFYPLSPEQKATLQDYLKKMNLRLIEFDLVKDKGEMAMRTVENVLKDGKGISGLSPFMLIYFKKPIEEFNLI